MSPQHDHDLNPRSDPPLDFVELPLGEMTPADYSELGFMAGLEIHQQLATRSKLFCRCPCGVYSERVDAEVLRHMRPTLSELGEYDGTALMEFKTKKEIVYRLDRRTVCTYEIDDTPPFPIDEEAVRTALEVARMCNLQLVSELHVMRKQYLDGSIPTGFQRTAMVGLGGEIPFPESELGGDRTLRIRQLSLEEDSCREVRDVGHRIVFRTDRLGIPLTETVTEPDLLTPLDVRAGIRAIARLAQATRRVRRGAGTARQDVNVSVAGGRRVEIKGVPTPRIVPRLVHVEAFRQLELLRIRAELRRRALDPEAWTLPPTGRPWKVSANVVDVGQIARSWDLPPVDAALELGRRVVGVRLAGFAGLLGHRTQPGLTFVHELAERVRVIACLESPSLLAFDPRLAGPDGWGREAEELRAALRADEDDGLVLLWGPEDDVATAAREVLARAAEALVGVPSETRQAHADGRTGFERILPGPDRMYPDTDTPPLPIPDAWVRDVEAGLRERPWERAQRYRALGLDAPAAWRLVEAPWNDLYDALSPAPGEVARRVAHGLEKRLARRALPAPERVAPLVRALEGEDERGWPALREVFEELLVRLLDEPDTSAAQLLATYAERADPDRVAARLAARRDEVRSDAPDAVLRWALGTASREWRGRVPVAVLRERLGAALRVEAVR